MTANQKRLLLFDIDGTLIHSGGAGVHALKSAFKERFGITDDLHDIEIAGMTDSGIVVSILNKHTAVAAASRTGASDRECLARGATETGTLWRLALL